MIGSSSKVKLFESIAEELGQYDNPKGDCVIYSDFLFKTTANTTGKRYLNGVEFPREIFPRGDASLGPTFVILHNKHAARIYTKMRRFIELHGDPRV